MKYFDVKKNPDFIGRHWEQKRLQKIHNQDEACMIIVYGRRRVGKTELIEQFFRTENILKFEGLQIDPPLKGNYKKIEQDQIHQCMIRLAEYTGDFKISLIKIDVWTQFFKILTPYLESSEVVLYFEEIQYNEGTDYNRGRN